MDGAPLRVLIVCDYFSTLSSGGSERVARQVAIRLAREPRVAVAVFGAVPRGWPPDPESLPFAVTLRSSLDLTPLVGAQLAVSPGTRRALRASISSFRPDVILGESLHFASTVAAASLSRATRIPLVTTAHLGSVSDLPLRHRIPTTAYERTIGRFILRRSAQIIAVSASVRDHIISLGVPPESVAVVPNGVDISEFGAAPRTRDATGPLSIAFTGRLVANKGPQVLVDAAALLRSRGVDVRIDLYGDGPLRRQLEQRLTSDGLANVRLHGHVTGVADILAGTEVLVRPSMTEGFPLGVLEAMAAGCAVVASAVPGNTDLVDGDETGLLVPPGDASALADALASLAANRDRAARFGAAGRERVRSYTWEACAQSTLRVLKDVAARSS